MPFVQYASFTKASLRLWDARVNQSNLEKFKGEKSHPPQFPSKKLCEENAAERQQGPGANRKPCQSIIYILERRPPQNDRGHRESHLPRHVEPICRAQARKLGQLPLLLTPLIRLPNSYFGSSQAPWILWVSLSLRLVSGLPLL